MCSGSSTSMCDAPTDSIEPSPSSDDAHSHTADAAHKYIGIIMVLVFILLAITIWAAYAKAPRRALRQCWGGIAGKTDIEEGGIRQIDCDELVIEPRRREDAGWGAINVSRPERVALFEDSPQKGGHKFSHPITFGQDHRPQDGRRRSSSR